jgi:hypothetical protein
VTPEYVAQANKMAQEIMDWLWAESIDTGMVFAVFQTAFVNLLLGLEVSDATKLEAFDSFAVSARSMLLRGLARTTDRPN